MISERLRHIIVYSGHTANSFSIEIGESPQRTNRILKNHNEPGINYLRSIIERYPEINIEWFITGKGTMLKKFNKKINKT